MTFNIFKRFQRYKKSTVKTEHGAPIVNDTLSLNKPTVTTLLSNPLAHFINEV